MKAMTKPNDMQQLVRKGPIKTETMKMTIKTAAFQMMGLSATTVMQMRGKEAILSFFPGMDLTNMYAMTNKAVEQMGRMISAINTVCHPAQGMSADNFSEG